MTWTEEEDVGRGRGGRGRAGAGAGARGGEGGWEDDVDIWRRKNKKRMRGRR